MENRDFKQWESLWPSQDVRVDRSLHIWESAVLLPLRKGSWGWEILFEVRSGKLNWQPGDICFPGGHREEQDATLLETALRETHEELGVPREAIQVLGPLEYFYGVMGPLIFPYAGVIDEKVPLSIQTDEVEELFAAPVQDLLSITPQTGKVSIGTKREEGFPDVLSNQELKKWQVRNTYDLFFYPYGKYMIWGITARILHNFLNRVRKSGLSF